MSRNMTSDNNYKEIREELEWFLNMIPSGNNIDFGTACEEDFVLDRLSVFIKKLRIIFPDILTRYNNSILRLDEIKEFLEKI